MLVGVGLLGVAGAVVLDTAVLLSGAVVGAGAVTGADVGGVGVGATLVVVGVTGCCADVDC
ncbi:MAG TPA: hypothetical protein VKB75_00370 [Jatrophihabitans sp.]|nr:hypothetical protein [Jatrophihabitans sp.]